MMYVEGKKTVMCNVTNGYLNTIIPDPIGGRGGITLEPGGYIDIEKILSKAKIRKYLSELEKMEANGYITFIAKGSTPDANDLKPPKKFHVAEYGTTVAPRNEFDTRIDELIAKDEKEDEETLPATLTRGSRTSEVPGAYDAAALRAEAREKEQLERIKELERENAELRDETKTASDETPESEKNTEEESEEEQEMEKEQEETVEKTEEEEIIEDEDEEDKDEEEDEKIAEEEIAEENDEPESVFDGI